MYKGCGGVCGDGVSEVVVELQVFSVHRVVNFEVKILCFDFLLIIVEK